MATKDAATGSSVTEYNIRVPKNQKKKYQVMRYNSSLNIDFQKWSQVKMERENNQREFKGPDEEQPKFGAGSEFGRDAREEARRKKFGIVSQRYKSEAQPWLIKAKQAGKSYGYRGVREGGIAENASYYVFTHAPDGGIDAYPLTEWYNFQPVHRYKSLSAEEAEDEFGRRNKLMNYFSVMTRKRCRGIEEDAELDDPDDAKAKKSGGKKKELKISDMDDWMDSSDEDEDGSGSDKDKEDKDKDEIKEEKDKKKKMKEKAANQKKKKKKKDFDDEAFEESDDGDEEGREVDYISDSSDSESDHEGKARKELQGVSEEKALRNLLSSGSSDEEDAVKQDKLSDAEEGAKDGVDKEGSENADKDANDAKKKKKKKKEGKKKKGDKKKIKKEDSKVKKEASSSEFSSDSDTDSEVEAKRRAKRDLKEGAKPTKEGVKEAKEVKDIKESTSGGSSRSCTPSALEGGEGKRKAAPSPSPAPSAKKPRLEPAPALAAASATSGSDTGITEDAVRRYLMRKPMTTTELLQKFKSKKTGLSSEQLVNVMTQILKRINPVKQTIKGKMYLSIKR